MPTVIQYGGLRASLSSSRGWMVMAPDGTCVVIASDQQPHQPSVPQEHSYLLSPCSSWSGNNLGGVSLEKTDFTSTDSTRFLWRIIHSRSASHCLAQKKGTLVNFSQVSFTNPSRTFRKGRLHWEPPSQQKDVLLPLAGLAV